MQWSATELADQCGGKLVRAGKTPIRGVFIDSRDPVAQALFVPIVAARDGHDFIDAAIEGGAAAVLVRRGKEIPSAQVTVVEVEDTLEALTRLAKERCRSFDGPIVTISGSNGKTTTRALVAAALGAAYPRVLCTRGNLNNHLGVPLTVLGEPHAADAMVVELGMSAPGENAALAEITQPTVHVITSVALEHLEFMGSIEAIAAAEAEPIAKLRKGGVTVLPGDEPLLEPYVEGPTLRFGPDTTADVRIENVEVGGRTRAELVADGTRVEVDLQLFGRHNARNAAAAIAVGHHLGIDLEAMASALRGVEPVGDRGRRLDWGSHWVIADCYNSNPGSVRVALESLAALRQARNGPLIAVLGDMLELGPTEDELHAEAGAQARALGLDAVLGFGPRSVHTVRAHGGPASQHFESVPALTKALRARFTGTEPGALLLKGSRGMRLERVLDELGLANGSQSQAAPGPDVH